MDKCRVDDASCGKKHIISYRRKKKCIRIYIYKCCVYTHIYIQSSTDWVDSDVHCYILSAVFRWKRKNMEGDTVVLDIADGPKKSQL